MFGKMMNRFYYGKSGKGDFTREDLPETRWQLFWEMLRVRFAALFRLNLIYMVAWIPVMIVVGRGLLLLYSAFGALAEAQAAGAETANITAAMQAIVWQTVLLLLPCMTLTSPFTAGVAYITRNWARDEHSFMWSDFWEQVKANWKQALPVGFITGAVPVLCYVCVSFYGQMAQSNLLFLVPQGLTVAMAVMWMCALMYIYPQMVTYRLTLKQIIQNAFIMVLARLPITVGLKLLSLVPAAIALVFVLFTPYALYALLVYGLYYVLLGFTLSRFVGASYANAVMDRYLNIHIEGAEVGRGLYKEEDGAEADGEDA